jgi:hypothetical protein
MNSYLALGLILGILFFASVNLDWAFYSNNNYRPLNQDNYDNTPSNFPSTTYTIDSVHNLNLSMSLDNTTIMYGQMVGVSLDLWNTLNTTNTVNPSSNWSFPLTQHPCPLQYPMDYSIFKGYYTADNISSASPVPYIRPEYGAHSCFATFYVSSYVFSPNSDNALLNDSGSFLPEQIKYGSYALGYWGYYWLGMFFPNDDPLQNLPPGVYTVVGGDEWEQLLILHFKVVTD